MMKLGVGDETSARCECATVNLIASSSSSSSSKRGGSRSTSVGGRDCVLPANPPPPPHPRPRNGDDGIMQQHRGSGTDSERSQRTQREGESGEKAGRKRGKESTSDWRSVLSKCNTRSSRARHVLALHAAAQQQATRCVVDVSSARLPASHARLRDAVPLFLHLLLSLALVSRAAARGSSNSRVLTRNDCTSGRGTGDGGRGMRERIPCLSSRYRSFLHVVCPAAAASSSHLPPPALPAPEPVP